MRVQERADTRAADFLMGRERLEVTAVLQPGPCSGLSLPSDASISALQSSPASVFPPFLPSCPLCSGHPESLHILTRCAFAHPDPWVWVTLSCTSILCLSATWKTAHSNASSCSPYASSVAVGTPEGWHQTVSALFIT